jgi:hypothetical protein
MKKIRIILTGVLLTASFSLLSSTQAQASDCSAEDPCGTWAVVDGSGVVTNIIVCQPSVCGSGTFGGNKVVLQVPANKENHTSQGGYYNQEPERAVTYNQQTNVFSMGSTSFPVPISRTETHESGTVTAIINSTKITFGPDSFINGQMQFTPVVDSTTGAIVYVYETDGGYDTISFDTPQTREQLAAAVRNREILQRRLDRIERLLRGWLYE